MIRKAMTFIDQIPEKENKMKYVKCMREACEKKIYLEVGIGLTLGRVRQMCFNDR